MNLGQYLNNYLYFLAQHRKKKSFLDKIVIGDDKYIHYWNQNPTKSGLDPRESSTSRFQWNLLADDGSSLNLV